MSQQSKQSARRLGISLIVLLGVALFPLVRARLLVGYGMLGHTVRDLVWIGLIALIFALLLAPLEALGWWAGWYGDGLDTTESPDTLEGLIPPQTRIDRYVIYLDGIGQATFICLPEVEAFLDQLAIALPSNILIIRGLIPYSVFNRPLTDKRPLAFFWRLASQLKVKNPASLISKLINLRNLMIVAVSADRRYGPIYNQGTAQVMYNSLINHGYHPGSNVPITLIGESGGGQISMGTASFLKQALNAPIDVISLGGVISGHANVLELEHLYHLVGEKDRVERIGRIVFPSRWPIYFLSYWNRAKRMGKISFISLGPVGHANPGGILDQNQHLPDGRSYFQQTVDLVVGILKGDLPVAQELVKRKLSNYERFQQAVFNQPGYYPLNQSVPPEYHPIAPWMGRLILPQYEQRSTVKGILFEVHHAPPQYQNWVGRVVTLRWSDSPQVQADVRAATRDLHFNAEAEYSLTQGKVHPERLNYWRQVDPLESLAGARPHDDVIVMLHHPVVAENALTLYIDSEPVQITGRFYGLVKILQPVQAESDQFRVVHFNRTSGQFDGREEVVQMPRIIPDQNNTFASTSHAIETSPLNRTGWYIYGAQDAQGRFVVQAIAPRALFQLQPDDVIVGKRAAFHYVKQRSWSSSDVPKGQIKSVLLAPRGEAISAAISDWQVGDRALLLHVYGGIGGNKSEPAARGPIYFGHFAYGIARVVREPLADELRFEIEYHQVYCHNSNGLIAGTLHWSRYMGDRQWGWLGIRPVCDILIKLSGFTDDYNLDGDKQSALSRLVRQLEVMTARYRIGDGTGGTYVGPANNCAQDSNQALYATIKEIKTAIKSHRVFQDQLMSCPDQARRFQRLRKLEQALRHELLPFGTARADWQTNRYDLGSSLEDEPLKQLLMGLMSWRTMLPRLASDTLVQIFLEQDAAVWVLRTNQVGGFDPDIAPVAPFTF